MGLSGVMVGFTWALRGQNHDKEWEFGGQTVGKTYVCLVLSCTEKTLHSGEVNTIIALQLFQ
jgi:hypothetical protein